MKPWDKLVEADEAAERLRRRAIGTQDERDWDRYRQELIRQGDGARVLDRLARKATLDNLQSIRKLLDIAHGMNHSVLLTTRMSPWYGETPQMGIPPESPEITLLVLTVTGNTLRVRTMRSQTIMKTRWSEPYNLNLDRTTAGTFRVVILRPVDNPDVDED